ncbi:MAG: hypothetical protein M3Z04_20280 [Chloroflexota bacterium]|nr:hypothetical protein [Chloroflexota bacterium]
MAVYREKRRTHPLLIAAAGVVLLLVIGGLVLALGGSKPAGETTPRARAQAGLRTVSDELDLFTIAYAAKDPAQTAGAGPALTAARAAFDRAQPDLVATDPAAAQTFTAALGTIERQMAAKAAADAVVPDATQLRADIRTWLARP